MIGRQLDRYRLLEEVGSGGMAVVYKGLDVSLDREVAVKVLHPHLAGKEESRRRFSREARAVARLRHPGIVEIYDFSGDEAVQSFIVTEFVKGRTLRSFGEEVTFGLPEIGALVASLLAEALEHAHEAGVVHRDLKPENVMVGDGGALKLMDFGIARMIGSDERMTMTGAMVGSPLHMPPEVIEGRESGPAADVFSLGTILYWMVTGRMAFEGANTTQTLRSILEGRYPDPRQLEPTCSDELAAVIDRCLRRDPAARFPGMRELREALRPVLDLGGIDPTEEELRSYFGDPAGYRDALRSRLVENLLARGQEALAARRPARALAYFDRVLALAPAEPRVHALLERMRRRRRGLRAAGAAGALAIAIGTWWAIDAAPEVAEATPDPVPPADVRADPAQAAGDAAPEDAVAPEDVAAPPAPVGDQAVPPSPQAEAPRRQEKPPRQAAAPAPAARRLVQLRWVPQGASLSIDGQVQATVAPAWRGELPVGPHTITLSHAGCCEPYEEVLELEAGEDALQRSIALVPRESGWFEIDCDLPDAEVWLDGTFKGTVADVNRRGGVAVGFSRDDSGRERYVKTVRFELLASRDDGTRKRLPSDVVVRAGQRARSKRLEFGAEQPEGGSAP